MIKATAPQNDALEKPQQRLLRVRRHVIWYCVTSGARQGETSEGPASRALSVECVRSSYATVTPLL